MKLRKLEEMLGLVRRKDREEDRGERPSFRSAWVELSGERAPEWLDEMLRDAAAEWPDAQAMDAVVRDIDLPAGGLALLLGHLMSSGGVGVVAAVEPPVRNPLRVVSDVEVTGALGRAPLIERTAEREVERGNEEPAEPAEPAERSDEESGGGGAVGRWGNRPSWL